MKIINWLVSIVLFVFWLAEDEMVEIENSIREGALKMSYSAYELLSKESGAFVEIGHAGSVMIGTGEQGSIMLSAQEAYSLLDVLYRHVDVLRQREDTVPLQELPAWAQPEERHDHLCRCPGCNYDGPEPTEEEGQRIMREMGPEPVETEQWQATATCQVEPTHTGRDVFRCDGCGKMCCNECGEAVEDVWLCERCMVGAKTGNWILRNKADHRTIAVCITEYSPTGYTASNGNFYLIADWEAVMECDASLILS